jgi:protocatechuate 3,4-dioxygenase beta subunit
MNDRRKFLKQGLFATGAFTFLSPAAKALGQACGLTPPQTSGPFFPGEEKFHEDYDLTQIPGHADRAKGEVVMVRGMVQDSHCKPVAGAQVEIWQACASGKYQHAADPNPAPLDPNFKYWAEATTDAQGRYQFKTIIPGAYPADVGWTRPPHIHFKVSRLGYHDLVTQMYFQGEQLNDADLILKAIPAAQRDSVIVRFENDSTNPGIKSGEFVLTLKSVRD